MNTSMVRALAASLWALAPYGAAQAHPHVWVEAQSALVFEDGRLTAVRHRWTFDDMYSAFLTQGLGKDPGAPTPEELQPLAQTNIDTLEEFDYFTFMRSRGAKIAFVKPTQFWLAQDRDKLVTLHFVLPLKTPLRLDASFAFQVYDPTYFVDFTLDKPQSIPLINAPQGCAARIVAPQPLSAADRKILQDSADSGEAPGVDFGMKMAGHVTVRCP